MSFNYAGFFSVWHASDKKYSNVEPEQDERWLPVIPVDRIIHTDDHPYCDDPECPCHSDMTPEALDIYRVTILDYKQDGLLTEQESDLIFLGKQI